MSKLLNMPRVRWSLVVLGSVLVASIVVAGLKADDKAAKDDKRPSKLATELIGAWELKEEMEENGAPLRHRLKFFTGKNWNITQAGKDGKVVYHHGGTYTLDGDNYTEQIEYANDNTAQMIGTTLKFKIKVEGDKYTQTGIGNPFTETWERIK